MRESSISGKYHKKYFGEIEKNENFHLARHTFATTVALSNGMPIETVSKILGYKKLSITQIYAKVDERKLSDDMDMLERHINLNIKVLKPSV